MYVTNSFLAEQRPEERRESPILVGMKMLTPQGVVDLGKRGKPIHLNLKEIEEFRARRMIVRLSRAQEALLCDGHYRPVVRAYTAPR